MRRYGAEDLRQVALGTLLAVGTHPDDAAQVAESLIDGNLTGHDSHGVIRLPLYIEAARLGHVHAAERAEVVKRKGATAVIDAKIGYGQPGMWLGTNVALEIVREIGVATTAVQRSYHIGRVAPYVEAIARAGFIGIALANCAPAVAPFGGRGRVFGTNPFAWAVPRANGQAPLSHDIATAAIAEGKLKVARAKGVSVAPGLIVDSLGEPSTNPNDFYDGGSILAFGGHKGSGISMLAQILGRGLAGMDPSSYDGPRGVNGPVVIAIDPECFAPLDEFIADVEAQCEAVLASPPSAGVDEILLPGQPEQRARVERERDGVPVADATVAELEVLCAQAGISMPEPVGGDV
ncbi:malate/lactate/ureidoglycolate dehydrogenase [soil metagenome]